MAFIPVFYLFIYLIYFWISADVSVTFVAEILYLGLFIVKNSSISIRKDLWDLMGREAMG